MEETRLRSNMDEFDQPTEAEIISLWQTFKSAGLSDREAWDAIVAGIALDMAFSRTEAAASVEH